MTRSNSSQLESFDPEIERTFRGPRNLAEARVSPKRERQEMDETPTLGVANIERVGNETTAGAAGAQNNRRTLMEYAQPSIEGTVSCIRKPAVQANNFKLKSSFRIQFNSMDCLMKIPIYT